MEELRGNFLGHRSLATRYGPFQKVEGVRFLPEKPKEPKSEADRPATGVMAHPILNPNKALQLFATGQPFTDAVARRMRGKTGADYRTPLGPYKEIMDSDPTAVACLQQRHADILDRDRLLQPADDSPRSKRARDLCEKTLEGFNWKGDGGFQKDLRDLLKAVPYGIAIMEVIWDYREFDIDGSGNRRWFVPVSLESRDPEAFSFDPITDELLIYQGSTNEVAVAPARKFIVYRPFADYEDNWGTATLRPMLWMCWFSRVIYAFWVKTAEIWGSPKVVMVPEDPLPHDKEERMLEVLEAMNDSTGILTEAGIKPYFLEVAKNGDPSMFERFVDHKNKLMRLVLLGNSLTTDVSGEGGGSAVGEVHERRQASITSMDARSLESILNSTVLRWTVEINMPKAQPPQLEIVTEPPKNITDIMNNLKIACEIGYKPSRAGAFDMTGFPIAKDASDELSLQPTGYAGATGGPQNSTDRQNQRAGQPSQSRSQKRNQKAKERHDAKPASNQPRPTP